MLLPMGSEPGAYDVQMTDSGQDVKAASRGTAAMRGQVTALQTTLDLAPLSPGAYQLGVRFDGDNWQLFPARVQ